MLEEILKYLTVGGDAGPVAADLAMKADPTNTASQLDFALINNRAPSVPGMDLALVNAANPTPTQPSWDAIVNPTQGIPAARNVARSVPAKPMNQMALTPQQVLDLMRMTMGQQQQQVRPMVAHGGPAAIAPNPPRAGAFSIPTPQMRPSLANILQGRR